MLFKVSQKMINVSQAIKSELEADPDRLSAAWVQRLWPVNKTQFRLLYINLTINISPKQYGDELW